MAGYHGTSLTAANSRCSFASNDSWLAWSGLDFSTYGTGNWFVRLTDSSGYVAEGYAGSVGSGESLGGELVTGWTNGSATLAYETFTTTVTTINSAINSADSGLGSTNIFGDIGKLYKIETNVTLNSGTTPLFYTKWGASSANQILQNPITLGEQTLYRVFATYNSNDENGLILFNNSTTNYSGTFGVKQITEPAATGIHILDGLGGSEAWAKIDSSFDYNDIVEIEIVPAATLVGITLQGVNVS